MIEIGQTWRIDGEDLTLVFVAAGLENIDLVYLGPRLPFDEDLNALARSGHFGKHENQPNDPPVSGLLPQRRYGYAGRPAYRIWNDGREIDCDFQLAQINAGGRNMMATWTERVTGLQVEMIWAIIDSRTITVAAKLTADNNGDIILQSATSLSMPLPSTSTNFIAFPGRWAREMQETFTQISNQGIEMRSANGKPGFDAGNWLIFGGDGTPQRLGIHASSNGDHIAHILRDQDGRAALSIEARVLPQGIALKAGDFTDLGAVTLILGDDQDHLSQLFHDHVRTNILPERAKWPVRKVHLNSWEALGFDMDEQRLKALANSAAELGVERFVLDDGWFKGRRSDNAGLGDWQVDAAIFPAGLTQLIDHIHSLDMDFGLWVEPEMVSPDSDLYRAHPDWCLHGDSNHRPTERNQLVLDLSCEDAFVYTENALHTLLDENDIAYLKWDHNRRLFPDNGLQQFAIDRMLRNLRKKYPKVEIESCSSGGGRVSFAILEHCHRIWPSDNNDPIERLRIMDNWTRFLPLEILGNHVGPSPNPITGRRTDMDFRAKVALFGHMGVEANPAEMEKNEREILRAHIALYKEWRNVLHQGQFRRLHHPDPGVFSQMVNDGKLGIAFAAQTRFAENFNAAPIRLTGLDSQARYKIALPKPWPGKASQYLANRELWENGIIMSGVALSERGIALPLTHPETAWLIAIEKLA
ncbi:alpha-galactosidase [Parasphingorhabdus halotolerans]|uniref:alpha-galactosidase n=1 Tax=Parasphingorhabdus halotolerans TaxID=2725558 RepID=A0A6H2DL72_9SPHN|nr:alpha-galactosidase [Parasphingorhabdus halotolerans]QJB68733.1 alpha-galactosidase [Parasphingorhabdus halotolerans]